MEMSDANVLVVFYSRTGVTEAQALAASFGAIQGRANIRLRRLRDATDEKTISAHAGWVENRRRMSREYIPPAETDSAWADAIIVAAPHGFDASSPELAGFLSSLRSLGADGRLANKIAGAFVSTSLTGDDDPGAASILSVLASAGMTPVTLVEAARESDGAVDQAAGSQPEQSPELAQAQKYGHTIARRAASLKSR